MITEAWVRVQPRPAHRSSAGVRFDELPRRQPSACGRSPSRACTRPTAACSIAGEAGLTMAGDGSHALLVLGFESTDHPVEEPMDAGARDLSRARRLGLPAEPGRAPGGAGCGRAPGARRFLGAPYVRDLLVAMGVLAETFETAITWERFAALPRARDRRRRARRCAQACGAGAGCSAASPTSTPTARPPTSRSRPGPRGARRSSSGSAIKRAVSDAIIAAGGTITHHHAVGRDHRPVVRPPAPEPFAAALRAAKAAVDPAGVMNPGVLIDPLP